MSQEKSQFALYFIKPYRLSILQVIDYVQYYLDLATANQREAADWTVEYNLTSYYGFHQVSPAEFHVLAESFTVPDGLPLFAR